MSRDPVELLRAALELEPAQRTAFIATACGDDRHLHARMLQLLALDEGEDTLLDGAVEPLAAALLGSADETEPAAPQPEQRIGTWRILAPLGSGGMGSVWLAERDEAGFEQKVALKLIKPGMDSHAVLRSFERERDLLARLDHPGIAHLVDGGIDARGRPWYAMRHVEGTTLDRWLQASPPLRARLKLFLALCRIVAHAHRQLVVHRDLKPGNVMVQPDGSPCLLDFGIAKILRDDRPEATATLAGFASPAYAAPEQLADGPITTATDVYALGAILFELLTDQRYSTVHRGGDVSTQPSRALRRVAVSSPIAVPAEKLRGDLDAISAQALAPDPARRYNSADALADDVQRYLEGRPVQARRASLAYRSRKWVQRNRLAAAGLLLALVALLAGTGISLWQAERATQEAGRALQEAERANTIKDYLIGLFDAGRTNEAGVAALDRRVVDLLEDSAGRLGTELADQPELRDEIYTILIEIFDASETGERSRQLAQERLEQAEAAFGPDDPRIAPALLMWAGVRINHGEDISATVAVLDRTQSVLDRGDGRDTLSQALLLRYRAQVTAKQQRDDTAGLDLLAQSSQLLRQYHPESDELLVNLFVMAQTTIFAERFDTAQAALDELRQRARARHGNQYQTLSQANLLEGRMQLMSGHAEDALRTFQQTRAEIEHFGGASHNDTLVARYLEIQALLALQNFEAADQAWQEAAALQRAHFAGREDFAEAMAARRAQIDAGLDSSAKAAPAPGSR